jgi:hypothetical protein
VNKTIRQKVWDCKTRENGVGIIECYARYISG